ncbi:MAG: hypothetical protein ACE5JI_22855 [Acidobacteriota bacterium]
MLWRQPTELLLASAGSYPRIGESPDQQRHRQAFARHERGEISREAFEAVQDAVTEEVVREQIEAGLDIVTDGQIRWYDPISHFVRSLESVQIDGLLRFFDTNCYFRQPVVRARLGWKEPILLRDFKFARGISAKPVKVVLTGPYSLARGSLLETDVYRGIGDLTRAYAEILAQEIRALADEGAALVQLDEPAILAHPEDLGLLREALDLLRGVMGKAKLALFVYFGDAAPLYRELQQLPIDVLGLDFTYSATLPSVIAEAGTAKILSLGLFDGRNTRIERREEIFSLLDRILPHVTSSVVYLTPSSGLEYLPRERARAKLEAMKAIRDAYQAERPKLRAR